MMAATYGRYIAEQLLGKGTMGEVYLGRDTELERRVAIKVLAPQGAAERVSRDGLLKRFKREAQAYGELAHPNIVALYDVGVTEGNRPYLVTEYVDGISLDKQVQTQGVFAPALAAEVGEQVARALQCAHDAGFVHRDVKPANIMLAADGSAKLMDFGIAGTATSSLTAEGAFLGSLLFSSPEQVSIETIDSRSDLFSLGTTLYVLLTGRNPFARKTVPDCIEAISSHEAPPITWLRPELGPDWDALFKRALQKDPAVRFADATAMADALAALIVASPAGFVPDRAPKWDLVIAEGPDAGQRFALEKSNVVGRRAGSVILSDLRVSSRHCRIEMMDEHVFIVDLKSTNGTWVDGVRIDTAELTPRSTVRLGPNTMARVIPRPAEAEAVELAVQNEGIDARTCVMPGAIDYVLVFEEGARKGERLPLGSALLLGRALGRGQLDDSAVAERHAIIEVREGEGVFVRDLDSETGTWLGDERVTEMKFAPGQKLRIGSTVLVLRRAESTLV